MYLDSAMRGVEQDGVLVAAGLEVREEELACLWREGGREEGREGGREGGRDG